MTRDMKKQPHVVVIGAGFGGLRAALALRGKPVRVTLVDRNTYHLFQPLLYQVATSTLAPAEIVYPVRATLRGKRNITFQLGEVHSIDLTKKTVVSDNAVLPYDYLIIAAGGQTNYFGNVEVARNGLGLKDLEDATRIRNHLLSQFEMAVFETDPEKRRAMLTFVVVGGGPTGVESAGAISELIRTVLLKDFPSLNQDDVRVILLEMTSTLLAHMPDSLGKATTRALQKKHVEVGFGVAVEGYDGQIVRLKDGSEIAANTLIWAAGVRAVSLLDRLNVEQDRLGRVKVKPTLQVPDHDEVFVIGDAANLDDGTGKPLPMIAPVAMQQANTAAQNVLNAIEGQPLEEFEYHDPGVMATIGRSQAVAWIGPFKLRGFVAWMIWLVVHIYQLIGFRNRLAVMIDWAWSYIFYERAARLIGPG